VIPAVRAQETRDPIRWSLKTDAPAQVRAGDKFNAQLVATIDEGWHLYSPEQPPGGPRPTRIRLVEEEPFKLAGEIDIPPPQVAFDPIFNLETQTFEGEVTFTLPVAVASTAPAGKHTLSVSATFQSCNQTTCLPPKVVKMTSIINIVSAPAKSQDQNTAPVITTNAGSPATLNPDAGGSGHSGLDVRAEVPEFSFKDFSGKMRKFSEFTGKYVLLDFWATWCQPCLADIPKLKELYQKHKSDGFEIIGMDSETLGDEQNAPDPGFVKESNEHAREIVAARDVTWTQAVSETAVPVAVKVFGVKTLPTKILIGRDGKVVALIGPNDDLKLTVERSLGEKK